MLDYSRLCLKCLNPSMSGGRCTFCGAPEGFMQEPAFALPAGTILSGEFLIGGVLGFGGFGITYMGLDLNREKKIAVKEFMPANMGGRTPGHRTVTAKNKEDFQYGLNRFYDEAKTIYHYRHHPHIVHVYKLFRENQTAYYAMEYLEGHDFKNFLKMRGGRIDFKTLMDIVLPVMDALECIHRDHVIHRDISPDNIYLGKTVKLIDFGAARVAFAEKSKSLSIILKKGFAPEEQYRTHGRQGPWTDLYALAGTMYYALSGKMVPEAPERLVNDTLADVRQMGVSLPDYSADAIMKALAVRAENRFASVEDFRNALLGRTGPKSHTICPVEAFRLYGLSGYYAGSSLTSSQRLVAGRDPSQCQLVYPFNTPGVSKCQLCVDIDVMKGSVKVSDLYSSYGTRVNGQMLPRGGYMYVNSGDIISFGEDQVFEIEF